MIENLYIPMHNAPEWEWVDYYVLTQNIHSLRSTICMWQEHIKWQEDNNMTCSAVEVFGECVAPKKIRAARRAIDVIQAHNCKMYSREKLTNMHQWMSNNLW